MRRGAPKGLHEDYIIKLWNCQDICSRKIPQIREKAVIAAEFTEWSVAKRRKFSCGARHCQAAGVVDFAHSRYATGASPPGLTEDMRIRL